MRIHRCFDSVGFEIFGCCCCFHDAISCYILPNPPFPTRVLLTESGLYTFDSPPVASAAVFHTIHESGPKTSKFRNASSTQKAPLIHGYNNLAAASVPLFRSQRGPSSTKSSAGRSPNQTSLLGYTTSVLPRKSSLIALILTNRLNKF